MYINSKNNNNTKNIQQNYGGYRFDPKRMEDFNFCLEPITLARPFSLAKKPVQPRDLPRDIDCATAAVSKW
jgi:hypothetical protein